MFFFSIFAVSAITRYKLSPLDPVFYTLSCQVFLYHSSFEVISWYVGLVTFKHVLPLLKVTNQRFLDAVVTFNAESLRVRRRYSCSVVVRERKRGKIIEKHYEKNVFQRNFVS